VPVYFDHRGSGLGDGFIDSGVDQEDPVFGGEDFLSNNPISPSSRPNIYTSLHPVYYKSAFSDAVDEYNVPPELFATVLQLENNYPKYGYAGYLRRTAKMASTPVLQIFFPGHDDGWGFSQGLANVKPPTAQDVAEYFGQCYPDEQSVEAYSNHFALMDVRQNLQYAAAHLRRQIDSVYGMGYQGNMSLEGLAVVISKYNQPAVTYVSSYGADGRALLVAASRGKENLYFWRE
jgi:hypothetical protein